MRPVRGDGTPTLHPSSYRTARLIPDSTSVGSATQDGIIALGGTKPRGDLEPPSQRYATLTFAQPLGVIIHQMSTPLIIIISEPDPMISGALRVEFSRWDFAVLLAKSSEEAYTYAAQAVASLVVLDATRAQLSAYEACARIRHRQGYAGRPIVLTAREISPRAKAAAEAAGATALLQKPYSVMDLFRAVTPHLAPS
jgi:CheY-like chemotaxis protein